ncbi:MAG: histidine phosphatase family protein [Chitinophagales bacterium]|nr:histidine phosphatase family protein [Chitinophagales bacterium]MDW8392778.1 histidine phosphatase family protein [Chitinophagales bacterium]
MLTHAIEKEIFLVRHGETDYNRSGMVQGRGVDPPLNAEGIRQSQLFFRRYGSLRFDAVFTSSLLRSRQSMEPFIRQGITWHTSSDLDEISWGVFEGKPAAEPFRSAYRQLLAAWKQGQFEAAAPQGESPLQVQQRMEQFRKVLIGSPYQRVLVCTHGRAMRILLSVWLGTGLERMDDFPHHNFTLYVLCYDGHRFQLRLFNNRDHLQA